MIQSAKPRLTAQFKTDDQGDPAFVESNGRKHYQIVFEVENAPNDAYAATFELDPTYYDSVRTLPPGADGNFRLEAASYGDYELRVKLRTKTGEVPVMDTLAHALRMSQKNAVQNEAVREAIAYIAKN